MSTYTAYCSIMHYDHSDTCTALRTTTLHAFADSPFPPPPRPTHRLNSMSAHRLVHTASPSSYAYCLSLLRRQDHENYLAHLLHPRIPSPKIHLATRALNIELVNSKDTITDSIVSPQQSHHLTILQSRHHMIP